MKTRRLGLSPTQIEFYKSESKYTLFCGGIGSGKTFGGALWALKMALTYPRTNGLITANSYSQLKKATLSSLFQILNDLGIDYKFKSQDGVLEIGQSTIYTLSMEKYDLLRGIEVGWVWSDECAFYREEAFDVMIGRIRDKKGTCQWKGTTTPNGFNWLYDRFVGDPLKNSHVIFSDTRQNVDNLSEEYVESLLGQYDEKLAEQELGGKFVNLTSGKVYYAFDRGAHVTERPDPGGAIFIGLDFNVDPLCGILCVEKKGKIHVIDEIYLRDSNTFEAAKEILRRQPFRELAIVPDESGGKRKTSAARTDHEILRRANLNVLKFKNPEVKDRYNNMNRLFDKGLITIDPKCKKLIEDLEKMTYDNKDPMLSHVSDALGYACWHLNPLRKPRRPATVRYI